MQQTTMIETEKVLVKGEKYYKVLSFSNVLSYSDLPTEYLMSEPRYTNGGSLNDSITSIAIYAANRTTFTVSKDQLITPAFLDEIITILKQSGERLAKINARIKADSASWRGTSTFII